MRLKKNIIENFLKGHITSSILDSMMDVASPFDKDTHLVLTGSAITYHLWHKGVSRDYYYKPPSDIDFVLSRRGNQERSVSNTIKFNDDISDFCVSATKRAGIDIVNVAPQNYETQINVSKTFSPDEIHHIVYESRMKEIIEMYGIEDFHITSPVSVSTMIDTMVLDNTVMTPRVFEDCHPNAEASAIRHQALPSSLAFKMARSMLDKFSQQSERPGDVLDI